jgi:hypothetical protein
MGLKVLLLVNFYPIPIAVVCPKPAVEGIVVGEFLLESLQL